MFRNSVHFDYFIPPELLESNSGAGVLLLRLLQKSVSLFLFYYFIIMLAWRLERDISHQILSNHFISTRWITTETGTSNSISVTEGGYSVHWLVVFARFFLLSLDRSLLAQNQWLWEPILGRTQPPVGRSAVDHAGWFSKLEGII